MKNAIKAVAKVLGFDVSQDINISEEMFKRTNSKTMADGFYINILLGNRQRKNGFVERLLLTICPGDVYIFKILSNKKYDALADGIYHLFISGLDTRPYMLCSDNSLYFKREKLLGWRKSDG